MPAFQNAIVSAAEQIVVRRVSAALDDLGLAYRVLAAHPALLADSPRAGTYFLDPRLITQLSRPPGPTVLVLHGARLSDDSLLKLLSPFVVPLPLQAVSPNAVLHATISAHCGTHLPSLAQELQQVERLKAVPEQLLSAFLRGPAGMTRLGDIRRNLAPLSREAAQRLVRMAGFIRAEHMLTAIRCATWAVLRQHGLNRTWVETYLGISDLTSFRRACRRAGVPAIHRHLTTTMI